MIVSSHWLFFFLFFFSFFAHATLVLMSEIFWSRVRVVLEGLRGRKKQVKGPGSGPFLLKHPCTPSPEAIPGKNPHHGAKTGIHLAFVIHPPSYLSLIICLNESLGKMILPSLVLISIQKRPCQWDNNDKRKIWRDLNSSGDFTRHLRSLVYLYYWWKKWEIFQDSIHYSQILVICNMFCHWEVWAKKLKLVQLINTIFFY